METAHTHDQKGRSRTGQVVLVTGCSGGFGFRAAQRLAERGHRVIAGVRAPQGSNRDQAAALTAFAAAGSHALRVVTLDVNEEDSVNQAVAEGLEWTSGQLHAVVNTAAYSVLGPVEACRPEQLAAMLNTNVVGALRLFRAVLPVLRGLGGGRIIQLTSGLGRAAVPFMGLYAASAWAQECFAEVLAYEAAAFGVDVAILEPAAYRQTERGGPPQKPVGDADRLAVYQDQLVAFGEHLRRTDPPSGDPAEVALAVVEAVEAHNVALRRPVGQAAEALVRLRAEHTGADYEQAIRDLTGLSRFAHPEE